MSRFVKEVGRNFNQEPPTAGPGSGTVTSVAMTVPSGVFTILGSPITSSGTLQVGLVNQLANTVWCGPTSGAESVPTFRALVSDDIPNLSASKITSGTLGVDRGGTGAVTLTGVLFGNGTSAFTGIASTTANQMLRVNSAGTGYEWFTPDYLSNPMTSLGDMIYGNAAGAPLRRSGNTTTTKMFLSQTGDGTSSAAPQWSVVTASDVGGVPTSRQLTINGTSYDLSADRSWSVGTITSLTGEATASGTGAVAVTLTNSAVIGKVLTGLNTSGGGNIVSTDTIVQAFGKVQNQITALVGGVMYEGTWNASTNTPTITSSTGNKGDYYVVSVAGSTTIDGISDWKVGDWIIFNGSTWQKVDNTDLVSSVNGYTGAVVLTTSDVAEGTNLYFTNTRAQNAITLTTSGTSGASTYSGGTLNIPNYSLSGLGGVPTTRTLTINGTAYDLSADRTWSVGTVTSVALTMPSAFSVANSPVTSSGTLAVTATGDTTQYIAGDGSLVAFPITGQAGTLVREVRNNTGATLTKGTVVYINGALGNKPTVAKALATSDATSAQTFGLIQADIPNNSNGYLVAFGDLDGLDTSAFTEGVQLYLSATTAGGYTITKQYAPNHLVYIGVVTRSHPTQGRIEVRIQNGYELDEIHDVAAQTPSNNDGLFYNSTNSLWENKSIATALGFTPVTSARTLTINDVAFDLSANRSWSVGDYGTW
jgi:predicted heme/steroid binding protein